MSARLRGLARWLIALHGRSKLLIVLAVDWAILLLSAVVAVSVTSTGPLLSGQGLNVLMLAPPLAIVFMYALRSYRAVIRFIGGEFAERAAVALALTLAALRTLHHLHDGFAISLATLGFFALIAFPALVMSRAAARGFLRGDLQLKDSTKVLIYGAGAAGAQLASALRIGREYRAVAFADDRADLRGRMLAGLNIYSPEALPKLKAKGVFELVLLAIPSVSRSRKREILEHLEKMAVKVLVMPSLDDIASGRKRINELREVQIDDLLERDPVTPVDALLDAYIRDKSVMITGAGGSIGAELSRLALQQGARKLVLFEASEYALYSIERELRKSLSPGQACDIVPVLANVLDAARMVATLREHAIDTVYHAAAYKHVPLVEANVSSAVSNNVLGTLRVVEAAAASNVRNFVLVSTDKAVRPTSAMGASKRVCELIVQAFAQQHQEARWSVVRFGNVLGSSGSVVPLFSEQIARGGPVTVTHPEVVRYFMTVAEAAQLVIQAGAMGQNGEVFVLDMGQPVRIAQLAARMIHLSGMRVRGEDGVGDIEIIYTGLRPGEKLYEELLLDASAEPSEHPRIFRAREASVAWAELRNWIDRLQGVLNSLNDRETRTQLATIVTGYVVDADPRNSRPSALSRCPDSRSDLARGSTGGTTGPSEIGAFKVA